MLQFYAGDNFSLLLILLALVVTDIDMSVESVDIIYPRSWRSFVRGRLDVHSWSAR